MVKMRTFFFFCSLFLLVACEKSGTNEHTLFQAAPSLENGVSFAQLNSFILKPMCLRCHAWAADETQVRARTVPGNPDASALYVRIANGSMPQGGPVATSIQLEVVETYIKGLRPSPGPGPAPLKPTYASLKVHLFEKSCTMCHNPDSRRRKPFTTYEEVTALVDDIQLELDMGSMPPLDDEGNPRAPVPTEEVLNAFREWVVAGMPRD